MQPSHKDEEIEKTLELLFGVNRKDAILSCTCTGCPAENIRESDFRDPGSLYKYSISGLCQDCQDIVSGGP